MMKPMNFSETIFLFFLALIIFGPKKLPEIARQVGKWMNELRRASNEFKAQIEQEIASLEVEERKKTILPPSSPPHGTASRALNAAPSQASQTVTSPAESGAYPAAATEAPATPAASEDEPLFAMAATQPTAVAAETPPTAEAVTASTSQESHA
jgi:sec-independent protein translocase protein TatB